MRASPERTRRSGGREASALPVGEHNVALDGHELPNGVGERPAAGVDLTERRQLERRLQGVLVAAEVRCDVLHSFSRRAWKPSRRERVAVRYGA